MSKTKISVIVVFTNEYKYIKKCISSVYKASSHELEVIIVDNSTKFQKNKANIQNYKGLRVIKNSKNLGYGGAVNIGIKHSSGNYILAINPDTIIFPNTIDKLLPYFKKFSKVGLIGCPIYDKNGKLSQSIGYRLPNLISHFYEYNEVFMRICVRCSYNPLLHKLAEHKKTSYVISIMGAFLFFQKEALDDIGLFDEQFFLYRDETDLCNRLQGKNWRVLFVSEGGLTHIGGVSNNFKMIQASPFYLRSVYRYYLKYNSRLYTLAVWLIGFLSALTSVIFIFFYRFRRPSQNYKLPLFAYIIKWHILNIKMLI